MGITERIDNITRIPEDYRHPVIPPPESVKIELTGLCNFNCAFCARSQRLREQKDMDQGLFENLALQMREAGVNELGLFYLGESFMVPWLPEAIKYAKLIGFPYVFLTTNGSLATPAKVQACMEAGLDSLKWSFNYADEAQLVEIGRVKKSYFERIIRNIEQAWKIREDGDFGCGLYASYIQYDGEQAEKMEKAVKRIERFVDEVYALPLYNQASLVSDEERERGWNPIAGNRGRVGALREPIPCWAVFTEGHITWDGKLSACCFDHCDAFTMADLTEVSFVEGWNSIAFQELRKAHLEKDIRGTPCENCVAYA